MSSRFSCNWETWSLSAQMSPMTLSVHQTLNPIVSATASIRHLRNYVIKPFIDLAENKFRTWSPIKHKSSKISLLWQKRDNKRLYGVKNDQPCHTNHHKPCVQEVHLDCTLSRCRPEASSRHLARTHTSLVAMTPLQGIHLLRGCLPPFQAAPR